MCLLVKISGLDNNSKCFIRFSSQFTLANRGSTRKACDGYKQPTSSICKYIRLEGPCFQKSTFGNHVCLSPVVCVLNYSPNAKKKKKNVQSIFVCGHV